MKLDEVVKNCIAKQFPKATVPDEENYRPDGSQYKAPDHHLVSPDIYVERKSLNPNEKNLLAKLNEVARNQNHPGFGAYGQVNIQQIIRQMPNRQDANRKVGEYMLNQMKKTIRKSARKIKEYFENKGVAAPCILFVSDHSDSISGTEYQQFQIGRLMRREKGAIPGMELLSGIVYLKDPRYVFNTSSDSWCNTLLRGDLQDGEKEIVLSAVEPIVQAVEHELVKSGVLQNAHQWDLGYFTT